MLYYLWAYCCDTAPRVLNGGVDWSATKFSGTSAFSCSSSCYRPSPSKERAHSGTGICICIHMHIVLLFIKLQHLYKSAPNFSYCVDPRNLEPHCEWEFWKVESNSKVSNQRNIQPIWEWPETTGTKVILKTQVWLRNEVTEKLLTHLLIINNNHNCLCDYYCHNYFQPGWPKHITLTWWRVYSLRSQSVDPVGKRLQRDALDVRGSGTVTGETPVVQVQQ